MYRKIFFCLFLILPFCLAAQRKPLKGKVVSDFDDLEGIYVINKTADSSAVTQRGGYFTIRAQVNDTLIFSALQFEAVDVVVTDENFGQNLLFVPLEPMQRELQELIIVDYSHINSESLGLVPKGQKQYTHAEKQLATASSGKINHLSLDPIINAFSGRTAMLEKVVETEGKEKLMEEISYLYDEKQMQDKFGIPTQYIKGFLFYLVENKHFIKAMDAGDEKQIEFMVTGLAEKFLKSLNGED
ncbi:hypothetical protein [Flavobacterium rhizosphaerae]|uniref:CarboxypepD_reg-like domain-containing protein n=1 Tax=Flavobacterium rhizosphaerae TaxID=3163298 RepID=A0ABW8YZF8_9FLAO